MDLKRMAEIIMLKGISIDIVLEHYDFRKGKTIEDIRKAVHKGVKLGNGKFEREVNGIEIYLKKVLKQKKVIKNEGKKKSSATNMPR